MKERNFITIPIRNDYYGRRPFNIGTVLKLVKEPENEYDSEAIKVIMPIIGTVGYVGNSISTVYQGTVSAGRLYDRFDDYIYACVVFVTRASVIASIVEKEEIEDKTSNELEEFLKSDFNKFCIEDENGDV